MKIFIFLTLFGSFVPTAVFAHANELESAVRLPGETFEAAEKRFLERLKSERPEVFLSEDVTAHAAAVPYEQLTFKNVPEWDDEDIPMVFAKIRDERFLVEDAKPNFIRRISWLYPQDGCFARAAMAGQKIDKWEYSRPYKLFIFGTLNVKTPNAPTGSVMWWYHVVPIVADQDKNIFVFDPAINAKSPLPVKDWILTMVPNIKDAKLSVCNAYSYVPYSPCNEANAKTEEPAATNQKTYLRAEWSNLESLKRNPEKELGEFPPWKNFEGWLAGL